MKKTILNLFTIFLTVQPIFSKTLEISSPDKQIKLTVNVEETISWSVKHNNHVVISKANIGMDFSEGVDFGNNSKLKKHNIENISSKVIPGIPHKDSEINDEFTELSLIFRDKFKINFRAYNDGVAYQFIDEGKLERNVINEQMSLTFPEGTNSLFPEENSMYSGNERYYLDKNIADISEKEFCSLPVLFISEEAKVLFTETALHDYPGMFVRGNGNATLDAIFPKYVLKAIDAKYGPDRHQELVEKADYIAKVSGERAYPWRVFIISNDDRTFVESNLTYQLAKPQMIENIDWVKPGKVAWDWYNANNIKGVDFKSGFNTETYKYYIDFASANGIEYVILDEGWTKSTTEITESNPDLDIKELIRYGNEKNVGLILWVLWKPLVEDLTGILETYANWGAKGIKTDFMQRNDQYMVNSYEEIAKECARLKLLVDFHGAFKPSGLRRAYPNVINVEGVKGAEVNKWSDGITPDHNVTIPFIRMAAGPMDYTPGSMINFVPGSLENKKNNFPIRFDVPASQGTRAHQVAMFVVYEAPLQMLCESPSIYIDEQETTDFIVEIPTTWDETMVLHGAIGEYIAVARRKGENWYIGAMTNWDARVLELDLSFLGDGNYNMEIYKDGVNADRFGEDYKIEKTVVNKNSKTKAVMQTGGGWCAIISK